MFAELITIGDELLIGQVVDTNSAWMGRELNNIGIEVLRIVSVRDREEEILEAIDNAMKRVNIVLVTGGLGPTKDDITKQTLCKYFFAENVFAQYCFQFCFLTVQKSFHFFPVMSASGQSHTDNSQFGQICQFDAIR